MNDTETIKLLAAHWQVSTVAAEREVARLTPEELQATVALACSEVRS